MASPFTAREHDGPQQVSADPAKDDDGDGVTEIPRRLMRVKVLYTFDDQNKSNCLARLPNALSVPTVLLDETTEVGVIELKRCIQAIATASPELVAKLDHDYTVYAYDYSEYETPLVGQGMLSWILASASATRNAPAGQSETMVTGRVCKNILGIFSNGIKETLEVKLKLIPVPTCLQREYVENMERYHSLSQFMPEGLDYTAWADFLRSNPAIAQLAHPRPEQPFQNAYRGHAGGGESIQRLLAQPTHMGSQQQQQQSQQAPTPFSAYGTRPSSPAMSAISFNHYQPYQDSRPPSQASTRDDSMAPRQCHPSSATAIQQDQPEDGPPKKRARVTKATRPRKTPLGATNESLRVAASTAASVRLHRPAIATTAMDMNSMEQIPRAPTPRPGDASQSQHRGPPRPPAPSLLRHASVDDGRRYSLPYESTPFSDNAIDSADDERGNSPGETPIDIPSSPPVMPQRVASSAPSSPGLPARSYPVDSGFVSDMLLGREDDETASRVRAWEGSDLPTAADTRTRRRQDRSNHPWTEVVPGPVELLPKSYVPRPKTYPRPRPSIEKMDKTQDIQHALGPESVERSNDCTDDAIGSLEIQAQHHAENSVDLSTTSTALVPVHGGRTSGRGTPSPSMEPPSQSQLPELQKDCQLQQVGTDIGSPDVTTDMLPTNGGENPTLPPPRAATPNPPPKRSTSSKPRGLPRCQTWSGEPMSDAAMSETGSRLPRSGSGAKRKQHIAEQLQKSLAEGVMPTYCNHCGEIETPTWRKAYTRIEFGSPADIQLSSEGTGVVGYEIVEPTEDDNGSAKYRIFKQALDKAEKEAGSFQQLNLCNPCGLWLNKKNAMRPRELWAKKSNTEKPKRKRNPPKGPRKKPKGPLDGNQSDAVVLHSEPVMPTGDGANEQDDSYMQQSSQYPFPTTNATNDAEISQLDDAAAIAALRRAIQSSPAGLGANKASPINIEPDLTPKPTRRLLFPSPRKTGEVKSLGDKGSSVSPTTKIQAIEPAEPAVPLLDLEPEDTDKENCPPPTDHDDLAHLFEDHLSPKSTPTKGTPFVDLLKTPTPGSRRRAALSAKEGVEIDLEIGLTTPSRIIMTPNRSGRAATLAPETPFTRQLNAMLSDCMSSPSQTLDLSAFPSFNLTPGRSSNVHFDDYLNDDFLSSDMPVMSSPNGGLAFSFYEDPATSTAAGLWSGASIFDGSDALMMGEHQQQEPDTKSSPLKLRDVTVDFTAMIEGVVGQNDDTGSKDEISQPEETNQAEEQGVGADGAKEPSG